MKVTVCFGHTRVIVPCGSGEILVADLIQKAVLRYKKAINKPPEYWVTVQHLQTSSDGGILDADDRLIDVADDREQIIAVFEEQDIPPHNGGDGTSASSVGTASPDMFHSTLQHDDHKTFLSQLRHGHKNDVVITSDDLAQPGSSLMVRRGSEPVLTNVGLQLSIPPPEPGPICNSKRWSAIAGMDDAKLPRDSDQSELTDDDSQNLSKRQGGSGEGASQAQKNFNSRFSRESGRQSMVNSHQAMYRWLESQQTPLDQGAADTFHLAKDRKEPLGGNGHEENSPGVTSGGQAGSRPHGVADLAACQLVSIPNTAGPLGIHVVPDFDVQGRETGLVIQSIEAGSRIYRDGRLQPRDRIIEINGTSLMDVDFSRAKEIFKQALGADALQLRVTKTKAATPTQAASPRPHTPDLSQRRGSDGAAGSGSVSPAKRTPPAPPERHPSTSLTGPATPTTPSAKILAPTNTKKIGKKIQISLTKGTDGLGFSITTRDNPTGGSCPIYIKNILPKGAAVTDGRLRSGDRLLEVNGLEITGKTQTETVQILRNMKLGSVVELVVSRQVTADVTKEDKTPPVPAFVPRPIEPAKTSVTSGSSLTSGADLEPATTSLQPPDKVNDPEDKPGAARNKELITLEIPLNETGSAGLGVSVKGKTATSSSGTHDLGIFIKSVITGGAASKDGRLKINDQLVEVNGESLTGKTNAEAMETLRTAMQKDGPSGGYIDLIVARRKQTQAPAVHRPGREVRVSRTETASDSTTPHEHDSDVTDGPLHERQPSTDINMNRKPDPHYAQVIKLKNPALERLGSATSHNIRNLSYQRATHDSNDSSDGLDSSGDRLVPIPGAPHPRELNPVADKMRPASTIGFLRGQPQTTEPSSRSIENLAEDKAPEPPEWLVQWEQRNSTTSETTPEEDTDQKIPFSRDGFGRQSMSEKRKGHVDPKISEFYQKLKDNKAKYHSATWHPRRSQSASIQEEGDGSPLRRASSMESLLNQSNNRNSYVHEQRSASAALLEAPLEEGYHSDKVFRPIQRVPVHHTVSLREPDLNNNRVGESSTFDHGPTLGLKKSSSLESLQTAVQEVTTDEQGVAGPAAPYYKPPSRMVRGRGCNESFRTAVDRSYDEENDHMDPLEEESNESESAREDSRPPSFTTANTQDNKAKRTKSKKEKSSSSLFKGLGSMFRFGRNRKTLEDRHTSMKTAKELHKEKQSKSVAADSADGRSTEQAEHDRVQEQYRKLQEKQRQIEAQRMREEALLSARAEGAMSVPVSALGPPTSPERSRADRIAQLRQEHQRRHAERRGHYPLEDAEERYEREIQEREQRQRVLPDETRDYPVRPPRRRVEEPGFQHHESRASGRAHHDDRQSHYANFTEIQAQLRHPEQRRLPDPHDAYHRQYTHVRERSAPATDSAHAQPRLPYSTSDSRVFTAHSVYVGDPFSRSAGGPGGMRGRSVTPNPASMFHQTAPPAPPPRARTPVVHPAAHYRSALEADLQRRPQSTRAFMDHPDHRQYDYHGYGSLPRRLRDDKRGQLTGAAQV